MTQRLLFIGIGIGIGFIAVLCLFILPAIPVIGALGLSLLLLSLVLASILFAPSFKKDRHLKNNSSMGFNMENKKIPFKNHDDFLNENLDFFKEKELDFSDIKEDLKKFYSNVHQYYEVKPPMATKAFLDGSKIQKVIDAGYRALVAATERISKHRIRTQLIALVREEAYDFCKAYFTINNNSGRLDFYIKLIITRKISLGPLIQLSSLKENVFRQLEDEVKDTALLWEKIQRTEPSDQERMTYPEVFKTKLNKLYNSYNAKCACTDPFYLENFAYDFYKFYQETLEQSQKNTSMNSAKFQEEIDSMIQEKRQEIINAKNNHLRKEPLLTWQEGFLNKLSEHIHGHTSSFTEEQAHPVLSSFSNPLPNPQPRVSENTLFSENREILSIPPKENPSDEPPIILMTPPPIALNSIPDDIQAFYDLGENMTQMLEGHIYGSRPAQVKLFFEEQLPLFKQAYRTLSKTYHPDKHMDSENKDLYTHYFQSFNEFHSKCLKSWLTLMEKNAATLEFEDYINGLRKKLNDLEKQMEEDRKALEAYKEEMAKRFKKYEKLFKDEPQNATVPRDQPSSPFGEISNFFSRIGNTIGSFIHSKSDSDSPKPS